MLKNSKYDSKDKFVQIFFHFYLKKIHHFGSPQHSSISALPGLDRKNSSTYWHIVIKLNLKFQLDNIKNKIAI
jgi:hypothetical protein